MLTTAGLKTQGLSQRPQHPTGHHLLSADDLDTGDLLFCIETADQGLAAAISSVTQGADGAQVVHVAIVCRQCSADPQILEASPSRGVWQTSLHDFLDHTEHDAQGNPLVIVGRLRDTLGVAASVRRAHQFIGLPYDTLYLPDDSQIYCSELVQLSYTRPDGSPIFPTIPMTFRDASGQIAPYWQQLYQQHGLPVPEGLPGSNPGALSRDTSIIIKQYKPL